MELAYRTCVLRLMETCRAFYSIGVPFLLRQKVSLNTEDVFKSFCNFLFATSPGPSNRPTLLRDLRIPDYMVKNNKSMVLQIISGATYLRSLHIYLPESATEFRNVLAGFSDLRELRIELDPGKSATEALRWFEQIRSPIETLWIQLCIPSLQRVALSSLSPLASTLRSLTLDRAKLDSMDINVEFPNVRELYLKEFGRRSTEYFPPSSAAIFKIFPNLESLAVPTFDTLSARQLSGYDDRVQEATDLGVHRKHLKSLEGCLSELIWGGYICSADDLCLWVGSCWEWDSGDASFLLSRTRPSTFQLALFIESFTLDMIPIIEDVPSLGSFKEIYILICVNEPDDDAALELTRSLPEALRGVDTELLTLDFQVSSLDTECHFLMHEFDIEEFFLQIHAVARKPRTIVIEPHHTRKAIFDVPVDFVESARRKCLDATAE
ncbi:hypothetical protein NLI96_g7324 [Meripilus lineatus]|uniref:Uncharacterized protein n=1 Tax=Meripilus lineatus TaxID=2056292 RepID=A0AAD5UZL4_9APHY|nr:hypothetical protein NLI96_g7324 [Physisporinus lineatus]